MAGVRGTPYRVAAVGGTVVATAGALLAANAPVVQRVVTTRVPLVARLEPAVLTGTDLAVALVTTVAAVGVAMAPLYRPQPRRVLAVVATAGRRLVLAAVTLAAVGYFDYTYRLPRATLLVTAGLLVAVLPAWFVAISQRSTAPERAVIVGSDPAEIDGVHAALATPVAGVVAPPNDDAHPPAVADGTGAVTEASSLPVLGGLSRLEAVLVDHDVDVAVLAFGATDRAEFFGALAVCQAHGVDVKVHRDRADAVLVGDEPGPELVDVQLEPWDLQTRVTKRLFDVAFAVTGLVLLAPVAAAIAVAIKLEDGGPVLYRQQRTAELGETFTVYKFRSMVVDAEAATGPRVSDEVWGEPDPRVTRVGRVLRPLHLDEIPQLWSVLVGDMSAVGPRPERPALESDIQRSALEWRRRWFVKPGLTGLAQVNGATTAEPSRALRYDLEYIRRQSIRYDATIVARQLWLVFGDATRLVRAAIARS